MTHEFKVGDVVGLRLFVGEDAVSTHTIVELNLRPNHIGEDVAYISGKYAPISLDMLVPQEVPAPIGKNIRGYRPDMIIVDDIQEEVDGKRDAFHDDKQDALTHVYTDWIGNHPLIQHVQGRIKQEENPWKALYKEYSSAWEGDICPACGDGYMLFRAVEGCTCHLGHPPCRVCTTQKLSCSAGCGLEAEPEA